MKLISLGLLASVFLAGCSLPGLEPVPEPPVLMGDAAPALGSEGIQAFIVGKWAVTIPPMDPNIVKQFGLESMQAEMESAEELREIYEFNADGTFVYSYYDQPWKVGGTWAATAQGISLTYKTYNGKTLQQLGEEKRREGETGTQAGVLGDMMYDNLMSTLGKRPMLVMQQDRKTLLFTTGETGAMALMGGGGMLSRAKDDAKK